MRSWTSFCGRIKPARFSLRASTDSDSGRFTGDWPTFLAGPDTERFSTGGNYYTRKYNQCLGCPGLSPGCCGDATTVVNRHNGTCDIAFLDGHVKAVKVSQATRPFTDPSARGGANDWWDRN